MSIMFTGLIQAIGTIESTQKTPHGKRFWIKNPWNTQVQIGESIAVQGVCLTVFERNKIFFGVDVIPETLKKTSLNLLKQNDLVNLERALQIGDRLGGHWVQGHIDEMGKVSEVIKNKKGWRLRVQPSVKLKEFIAEKGSITIDGVSLTVSKKTQTGFEVALIPETLQSTTLANLQKGSKVNLEVDLIARYLKNLLNQPSK